MALLSRWRRTAAVSLVAATTTLFGAPARAQRALEYEVKAAFLYNFIKFVEWPPDSLRPGQPFRVCTYRDDPFDGALERTVAGDTFEERSIVAERVSADETPGRCQILFVPQSQSANATAAIRAAGTGPVLIVGESPDFLRAGGVVNFIVDAGHVRFDVNVEGAAARRLRISSKLLRIARSAGSQDQQER